ncbi:MAG TPA: hypothetical protein VHF25_04505 [Nitriliruptorales bacterium]|nr:hypothetical protein [Nitriliruptorales bacterium]
MLVLGACGGGQPDTTEPATLPASHHVHALRAADDGTLLLGLHGALWRSTDGGSTWRHAGLEGHDAMAIGIGPDADGPILIGGHGMLARADDPTADFTPLSPPELGERDVHALAQTPSQPTTAYAFEVTQGLFRTDDGGDSWQLVAPVGRDFGPGVAALAVHPTDTDTLVIGSGASGLLRSTDGGATFQPVIVVGTFAVAWFGDDADRLVAATERGIETSDDAGQTWQVVTEHGTLPGQLAALAADRQGDIWVVTEKPRTLQRSSDGGTTWEQIAGA